MPAVFMNILKSNAEQLFSFKSEIFAVICYNEWDRVLHFIPEKKEQQKHWTEMEELCSKKTKALSCVG